MERKRRRGPARKYRVTGLVTISVSTEVLASSEKEALAIANERGLQSLCVQCARPDYEEEWGTSGELDGEVRDIRVDEED